MTSEQIILVKKTWRNIIAIKPEIVADLFYSKLFADTPALRKMFPSKMQEQYQKLMDMLNAIVIRLDRLDELTEEIAAMAQRHEGYGVRPAHYKLVGSAFLWTLQKGLGNEWTEEVKTAWTTCYNLLADTMINSTRNNVKTQ